MWKDLCPRNGNEEAHLVNGVHEAIVSEEFVLKVQKILNKRMETKLIFAPKEKLRDELPLRGHLKCPQCGKIGLEAFLLAMEENILTTIAKKDARLEQCCNCS